MRKKYLIKPPSSQPYQHLEYSSILTHSQQPEHASRGSHNRPTRPMPHRLKTEPANEMEASGLRRKESSVGNLRKGRYFMPGNKQNAKVQKSSSGNRLTYNQYRGSEFLEMDRGKLDTTLGNNRFSENKHVHKKSLQKVTKMEKYKLCAPKNLNKMKAAHNHTEIHNRTDLPISNQHDHRHTDIHNMRSFNRKTIDCAHEENDVFPSKGLNIEDIHIEQQIGSGTFGKVYSARLKSTGTKVAVKKVQQDKKYKTRELEIVKMLESPYIVKFLGTFTADEGRHEYLNIIMETFDQNFFQLLKMNPNPSSLDLKCYVYQMIRGLLYLHSQGICHRDLKPQNMLIKQRRLVLCDFGSAKILKPGEQNISYICSRCYRAPELIFEATNYTTQIDMWSLGCILLEILNGRPLFIADSSLNHILEVIKVLGTPSKDDVRCMNPQYQINDYDLPQIKRKSFKALFPGSDPLFLDLTEKLVRYAPNKRLSAAEALTHPYFDDLRDEKWFRPSGKCKGLDYFFGFEQDELPVLLRDKLVPKWWQAAH